MGKRKLTSKIGSTNDSNGVAVTDRVAASQFPVDRGPWVKLRRLTSEEITAATELSRVDRNSIKAEIESDGSSDCEVIEEPSSKRNRFVDDTNTTSSSSLTNGRRNLRQRVEKKIVVHDEDKDDYDSDPSETDDKKDDDYKRESSEDEDDDVVSEVSVDNDDKYDSDWTGSDNLRTMKYNRSKHKRSTNLNLRQKSGRKMNYAENGDSDSGLDEKDLVPVKTKIYNNKAYPVKMIKKGRPYLTILTFGKNQFRKFDDTCRMCKEIGKEIRLYCSSCTWVLHPCCLNPPVKNVPADSKDVAKMKILCPKCMCKPILGDYDSRPSRILSMRYVDQKNEKELDPDDDENDGSDDSDVIPLDELTTKRASSQRNNKSLQKKPALVGKGERQFFVHLRGKSFWDCLWTNEIQMRVFHTSMYFHYLRKREEELTDPTTSFTLNVSSEDGDDDEEEEGEEEDNDLEEEFKKMYPRNELVEKYYKHGVRPTWLRLHRIINHKEYDDGSVDYLVKWRDLDYGFCNWEEEKKGNEQIPGFKKAVEVYKEHREFTQKRRKKRKTGRHKQTVVNNDDDEEENDAKTTYKHIHIPPKSPVTDLTQKYEMQPDFVDAKNRGLVLYNYQLEGLNWIRYSWSQRTSVILADEMGLGKTIQAILFFYSLYKEGHCEGPFLISAPLSTIINWERELELWAPDLYVVTYIGGKDTRSVIRVNDLTYDSDTGRHGGPASKINGFPKFNVLLTSHDMIVADSACLWSIPWQVLLVDEGHRLRDCDAKFFRYVNQYDANYKLVLTGTPLQNNLEELFHLLNFLSPDKFNDLSGFQKEFTDVSKEDQVTKLHQLLGPHLLRRLKADVLKSLPSKSELIVTVEMSPMQQKYYKYVLTKNFRALNSKSGGKTTSLLNIMMDLRKCCNHPYLFSTAEVDAPTAEHLGEDLIFEINALTRASGKLILLQKMLKFLREGGHRVLIFSQFTRMLDILEDFLDGEGYKYERIDGNVHGNLRQEAIDRFNAPGAEQFVFLLSTRAGGLGINLATADTVVVYDSDWNPHNDIQAFSRAHRIGQERKVMIYRFVTKCSVEERIAQVAKKKMMLAHLVVRRGMGSTGTGLSYTKQEMEDIVRYGTEELFKNDQNEDNVVPTIQYTDEMIQKLLDRNQKGTSNEKETFFNEYLSKFKVVNYTTNDDLGTAEEADMDIDNDLATSLAQKVNHVYWEELLGRRVEHEEQKKQQKVVDFDGYTLRQKRIRRQVPIVTIQDSDLQ